MKMLNTGTRKPVIPPPPKPRKKQVPPPSPSPPPPVDTILDIESIQEPEQVYHKKVSTCHNNTFDKTRVLIWFNFIAVIVLFILVFVYRPQSEGLVQEPVKDFIPSPVLDLVPKKNQILFTLSKPSLAISFAGRGINFDQISSYVCCCTTINEMFFCGNNLVIELDKKAELANVSITDESLIGSRCKLKIKSD